MSVITPNETAKSWHTSKREPAVHLCLSGVNGEAAELVGGRAAGLPLILTMVGLTDRISPEDLDNAVAAVVQVDANTPASVRRFEELAATTSTPLIAAAYEPPLALVRSLVRAGAHDVIPLPLTIEELEASLTPLRDEIARRSRPQLTRPAKVVSAIKSVGGVGATAMLCQLASRFAKREGSRGREACLVDFDVQFGDAAFQLGLRPKLSLSDLIEAGARLDGDLIRATSTPHPSGLQVIAAPPEMMPLESLSSELVLETVEAAAREFGTIFVDLPANWTNWSLSILARSDLVLLFTELTVASLHRARRQIDLIDSQDLGALNLRVVANRFEKSLLRTIRHADVKQALGRELSYTICDDPALVRSAIDQGVTIDEIKRKSAVARDLDLLDAGVAAALKLER
jgi:pilus assembly protein CpaE